MNSRNLFILATIFSITLVSIPAITFSGSNDVWKLCDSGNLCKCPTVGSKYYCVVGGTGSYVWSTADLLNACSYAAPTYFADKCSTSCTATIDGKVDRGDNVCRSSAYASDCTATSYCNSYAPSSGHVDTTNSNYCDICSSGCVGSQDSSVGVGLCTCAGGSCNSGYCWSATTCYYSGTTGTALTCNSNGWDYQYSGSTRCSGSSQCCPNSGQRAEGVGCTATGTTGAVYDRDTSSARCTDGTSPGCTAYNWYIGGEISSASCCGDDSDEYNRTRVCESGICATAATDDACCLANNKCVYSSTCYADNYVGDVDSDGTNERCDAGTWRAPPPADGFPSCSVSSITESSNYAHTSGTTVWYSSASSGSFTVNVTATDDIGINKVNFPNTVSTGGDDTTFPYSKTYNWDTGDANSYPAATVTAYDTAGQTDTCSFDVTRDVNDPTTTADISGTYTITLTCADNTGGSGCYKTYYCVDTQNTCTLFTVYTTAVTQPCSGTCYVRYYSKDNVNNQEDVGSTQFGPTPTCTGSIRLSLSPNPVSPSGSVTPSASGLSTCSGKTVSFKRSCSLNGVITSCTIDSGSGCDGTAFTAPSTTGSYAYAACIDKNGDADFSDTGESDSETLTVSVPSVPSLSVSASPSTITTAQSSTITAATSDAISGVAVSFSTTLGNVPADCTTVAGACSSTFTSAAIGTATITATATDYTSGSTNVTVTPVIPTDCSYSLSISPAYPYHRGDSKTWSVSATDSSTGEGCPSSITYTISSSTRGSCDSPNTYVSPTSFTITRGSTLNNAFSVKVKRTGSYCTLSIDVSDPNGGIAAEGSYSVEERDAFDYSLSLYQTSGSTDQGGSVSTTTKATRISDTSEYVDFSCSVSPSGSGVGCSFNPPSCRPTCTSDTIIATSSTTPPGTYTVTIKGLSDTTFIQRTAEYILTVNQPPSLSVSANPSSITTDQSSAITATTSDSRLGVSIALVTDIGTLNPYVCTTDTNGSCTSTFTSSTAGTATITASAQVYTPAQTQVVINACAQPIVNYVYPQGLIVFPFLGFPILAEIADDCGNPFTAGEVRYAIIWGSGADCTVQDYSSTNTLAHTGNGIWEGTATAPEIIGIYTICVRAQK